MGDNLGTHDPAVVDGTRTWKVSSAAVSCSFITQI